MRLRGIVILSTAHRRLAEAERVQAERVQADQVSDTAPATATPAWVPVAGNALSPARSGKVSG